MYMTQKWLKALISGWSWSFDEPTSHTIKRDAVIPLPL